MPKTFDSSSRVSIGVNNIQILRMSIYDVELEKMKTLNVKQWILVLMGSSFLEDRYMGLGYSERAMSLMLSLKTKSFSFGGDFTLLWHNSHLPTELNKKSFAELIV
jgi:hypothetical protein